LPLATTGPGSAAPGGGTLSWTAWFRRAKAEAVLPAVPPPTSVVSAGRAGSIEGCGISAARTGSMRGSGIGGGTVSDLGSSMRSVSSSTSSRPAACSLGSPSCPIRGGVPRAAAMSGRLLALT
jgi:hypothetical protein